MKASLKNNESGFTLFEALLAVMLSSVILLFLCTSIQQLKNINERIIGDAQTNLSAKSKVKGSRQIEWHLFLKQLERYLEDTKLVSSTSYSLIVKEESDKNIETKYGRTESGYRSFYRSKNNGHNILLTDIKRFSLEVNGEWLHLHFTFQNNEEYSGKIWVGSWKKEKEPAEICPDSNQKEAI